MKIGPNGEIYLQALNNLQEVMIPANSVHNILQYLQSHFSKKDVETLLAEIAGKKVLKREQKIPKKYHNGVKLLPKDKEEFLEKISFDKNLDDPIFETELNLDHSQFSQLLILTGRPQVLEKGGSITYKKLLKEKGISNTRLNFPITKVSNQILKLFKGNEFLISTKIYGLLSNYSIVAIRENLKKLVKLKILRRFRKGKFWTYQVI